MMELFVILFVLEGLSPHVRYGIADAGGLPTSKQGTDETGRQEPRPMSTQKLQQEFTRRHAAWRAKLGPPERILWSSSSSSWVRRQIEIPEFNRLVQLGPRAVPFLVETIEANDKGDWLLNKAVEHIIRRKFGDREDAVKWWKGRPAALVEFDKAHAKWRLAKANGNLVLQTRERVWNDATKDIETRFRATEMGQAYESMRAFGIDALPTIVEKIKAGDHDLIPLFQELTGGVGIIVAKTSDNPQGPLTVDLRLWEHYKDRFLLPPVSAAKLKDDKR